MQLQYIIIICEDQFTYPECCFAHVSCCMMSSFAQEELSKIRENNHDNGIRFISSKAYDCKFLIEGHCYMLGTWREQCEHLHSLIDYGS